ALGVVVGTDHEVVRRVDEAAAAAEDEQAAVVGAFEHGDLGPTGRRDRGGQGQQVGLGPRVGEAQQIDRGEAVADGAGEARLGGGVTRQVHAVVDGLMHSGEDLGIRVAEQAGGVLPEQVDV